MRYSFLGHLISGILTVIAIIFSSGALFSCCRLFTFSISFSSLDLFLCQSKRSFTWQRSFWTRNGRAMPRCLQGKDKSGPPETNSSEDLPAWICQCDASFHVHWIRLTDSSSNYADRVMVELLFLQVKGPFQCLPAVFPHFSKNRRRLHDSNLPLFHHLVHRVWDSVSKLFPQFIPL